MKMHNARKNLGEGHLHKKDRRSLSNRGQTAILISQVQTRGETSNHLPGKAVRDETGMSQALLGAVAPMLAWRCIAGDTFPRREPGSPQNCFAFTSPIDFAVTHPPR